MKRKCQECGDLFEGRSDKRFCTDQCRNTFNNRLKKDSNNLMRNINNTLRKNRRILEGLNTKGKTKVHKSTLLDKGFNFNYMTNQYQTKKGGLYKFCYDQGYIEIENNMVTIVKRQEYV